MARMMMGATRPNWVQEAEQEARDRAKNNPAPYNQEPERSWSYRPTRGSTPGNGKGM